MRVRPGHSRPVVVRVGPGALLIRHTVLPVKTVMSSPDPYHLSQGWRFENDTWKGVFRAGSVECPGEIWQHYKKFCARIERLPGRVRWGWHAACFVPDSERPGWHRIHFSRMPQSVDGTILTVERLLAE